MRKTIEIGENEFATKKDALEFYRNILNSYEIGEILNSADFENLFYLLEIHPRKKEKIGSGIASFRIGQAKFNTKSFEILRTDGTAEFISFTKHIGKPKSPETKFREACRQIIQTDLRNIKQSYFKSKSKNGKAKCQESDEFLTYEELNIDHRQPNTFSVIVDRFIEIKNIDLEKINYDQVNGGGYSGDTDPIPGILTPHGFGFQGTEFYDNITVFFSDFLLSIRLCGRYGSAGLK